MISSLTDGEMETAVNEISRYARLGHARVAVGWRRAWLSLSPTARTLCPGRAVADLPGAPHVLVLCLGNICRSPMVERYLRRRTREAGLDGVTVESAGFVEDEGRPSPDLAVELASEHGVDLDDHRSTVVAPAHLERSDVVFLMDAENLADLQRGFDRRARQSYFLRVFTPDDRFEILDPYGGDRADFRRAFDAIATGVDRFVSRLEDERG